MSKKIDEATVKAFANLFRGRVDAFGSVEGRCIKEKVTIAHYRRHLLGDTSLGVYMMQDDNTCRFFAIDYDIHDINTVLKIRQAFRNKGLPVYLAASKSKGNHLYGFAEKPLPAPEIRRACISILTELGIECEVFPKQDQLDVKIPYGNYINLPSFGFTRTFLTGDLKEVPIEQVVTSIKKISPATLKKFVETLPAPKIPAATTKQTRVQKVKGGAKKGKHPPCVEEIMKGVGQGGRDVAAFALARHFLDQYYTDSEVLGLLTTWDELNRPPIDDVKELDKKVKSASKGYAFGCASVNGEPALASYCVGEENCVWLKKATAEKMKNGLIREITFHEDEENLYEEIWNAGKAEFARYNKKSGVIDVVPNIENGELKIVPVKGQEISEGAIFLPTGVADYKSTVALVEEIKQLINDYVDLPSTALEFSTWYIIMSWVYDRLVTLSYLRFRGDTGCGKSRALDVIGRLCYKPLMMAGAATPAPIYREIRRFRGTVILEEADFSDRPEKSEVVTILNCGFEKNRPVIRCSRDNPDNVEILPCYGPKVFATRGSFTDKALEARCLTFIMKETDRDDMPPLLGQKFYKRSDELRCKLLKWRLEHYEYIDANAVEDIDLGPLEPRLKQVGLPFAIPFKDMPEVLARFKSFMKDYGDELIAERNESVTGRVIASLLKVADEDGVEVISSAKITTVMSDDFGMEMKPGSVGKQLKSLHLETSNHRVPGQGRARYLKWNSRLIQKLMRRYLPADERKDYFHLFREAEILDEAIDDIDMVV
ncbi:primase C-terminal domain-containing protein [Chloroflexota bacterium]